MYYEKPVKGHCPYYRGDRTNQINVIANNILMTAKCFCTLIKHNKNCKILFHRDVIVLNAHFCTSCTI